LTRLNALCFKTALILFLSKKILLNKVTPSLSNDVVRTSGLNEMKQAFDYLIQFIKSAEINGKKTIVSLDDNEKIFPILFPMTFGVHGLEMPSGYNLNNQNSVFLPVTVGLRDLGLNDLYNQIIKFIENDAKNKLANDNYHNQNNQNNQYDDSDDDLTYKSKQFDEPEKSIERLIYTRSLYMWKDSIEKATHKVAIYIDQLKQKINIIQMKEDFIKDEYSTKSELSKCFD